MVAQDDFRAAWRDRLASGSKLSARALASALKEDPTRAALVAPLMADAHPLVKVGALRAFEDLAYTHTALVAPYAKEVVEALAAPETDAQAAALAILGQIGGACPAEIALALPLVADLLVHKRPGLREEAARCLGRLGAEVPQTAPVVAERLAGALAKARAPRAAPEAREILAALETLLPHLPPDERAALTPAIAPLRAHPNLQVRERAGRLAKQLAH